MPSYEMNIESFQLQVGCFLAGLFILMFTSCEGNNCLVCRNYFKMFMTWMFFFSEINKIISGIENTITEPDWQNIVFHHTSGCQVFAAGRKPVVDRVASYCLLIYYICLGLLLGHFTRQWIFRKTYTLSYYFYVVQHCVRRIQMYFTTSAFMIGQNHTSHFSIKQYDNCEAFHER